MGDPMRRYFWVTSLFIAAGVLWAVYLQIRVPPGVEAKGPTDWLPWISLAGAIISFISGVVGLISKLVDLKR